MHQSLALVTFARHLSENCFYHLQYLVWLFMAFSWIPIENGTNLIYRDNDYVMFSNKRA